LRNKVSSNIERQWSSCIDDAFFQLSSYCPYKKNECDHIVAGHTDMGDAQKRVKRCYRTPIESESMKIMNSKFEDCAALVDSAARTALILVRRSINVPSLCLVSLRIQKQRRADTVCGGAAVKRRRAHFQLIPAYNPARSWWTSTGRHLVSRERKYGERTVKKCNKSGVAAGRDVPHAKWSAEKSNKMKIMQRLIAT